MCQSFCVESAGAFLVDGTGHTAHQVIRVRILSTEDGVHLYDFLLPFKGLKVMRNGQEIYLSRKLHLAVSPVSVGENTKLTAFHELLDSVLNVAEIARRAFRPFRNALCNL